MSDRYTQNRGKLPASYVTFIEECGAWEGDLGDYYGYIVLWRMEEIQEQWIAYEMEKYLPAYWFAIGTNGGGDMVCFDLRTKGDTTYYIPFIGMSESDAMEHCVSFSLISDEIKKKETGA